MRIPVPRNRLVVLSLVGAVLTGAIAVGLATPGAFGGASSGTDAAATLQGPNVPTPNANFTPAVSQGAAGGGHEDREDDGFEFGEHEDD